MELHDMLSDAYGGILRTLEYTLEGLNEDDLNWQPKSDCNSIGWLVWHLTRWQDVQISSFMKEEQLWIRDKWHEKFGRPADPQDHGMGHTPEDLAKFTSPGAKTLLDYQKAVLERSQRYFPTIKKSEMDGIIEGTPIKPPPTFGMILLMTLSDGMQHAGQAAYIRGLLQGYGWH